MYIVEMMEVLRYIFMVGMVALLIHQLYLIHKIKKRNPQDHIEIRLLHIELWIYIIMAFMYCEKNIGLFISLYID